MNGSDDRPAHEPRPYEPRDRIAAAFRELKEDTLMMQPQPLDQPTARPTWLWPAVTAGIASVLLIAGIVAFGGGDGTDVETPLVTDGPNPTGTVAATDPPATTVPGTSIVATGVPTSLAVVDDGSILTADADGYFPWLFPTPSLSWYEEGCPAPESVIADFAANIGGAVALGSDAITLVGSGENRQQFSIDLPNGEGGQTSQMLVSMAKVDPGVVECEAWAVLEAWSPDNAIIDSPTRNETIGNIVTVSGSGSGFEATIELELLDESYSSVGESPAMAGSEPTPFEGEISFDRAPIDANVMVLARSSNPADGSVAPFAAVKVRYLAGDPPPPPTTLAPGDAIGPVAVVGVAFDDVLNARSGAGVQNEVVGEISPFEIGITQYAGEQNVGGAGWVQVGNPQSRDFDAWVNSSFLTFVSGEAGQPAALYNAVTDVREALSLNASGARLADVIAGSGGDGVRVSTDAFVDLDTDQVLTLDDLSNAGTAADETRLFGFQDGTGDPIEITVAQFLDQVGSSKALTQTENVAVNERIKFGNTIDNMAEAFPDATIVELHYTGDDGETKDFTWATVRLAFAPQGENFTLIALALDGWTI